MAVAYGSNMAQLNSYRSQSVAALTPAGLLLKTYDIALNALSTQDSQRSCKAIANLIDALDFEHAAEFATGLFRLYRYCIEQIKQGQTEVPSRILQDLRDTWAQAIQAHGDNR